jgi:hypothetical protein
MDKDIIRDGDGIAAAVFMLRLYFGRLFWPLVVANGLAYLACAYAALP